MTYTRSSSAWRKSRYLLAIALLVAGLAASGVSYADSGNRLMISFTNYAGAPLTNFPALVKLSTNITDFTFGGFLSTNGDDLRFWNDAETTNLNYEIEQWDTNGTSFIWVQVTNLVNNCCIWATWGDSSKTNREAYTTNGATWSEGYAAVYHLNAGEYDSTSFRRNGTKVGTTDSSGQIANGEDFNNNARIEVPLPSAEYSKVTHSFWVSIDSLPQDGDSIIHDDDWLTSPRSLHFMFSVDGKMQYCVKGDTPEGGQSTTGFVAGDIGKWCYLTAVYDSDADRIWFYRNGVADGSSAFTIALPIALGPGDIGSWNAGRYFDGKYDEFRISTVARSADWEWACWMNQGPNHHQFVSYGERRTLTGTLLEIW